MVQTTPPENLIEKCGHPTRNLTIFQPSKNWVFSEKDIQSQSKNTPLIGEELEGKVLAVVNKKKIHFN